ncbi:MAG TPA: alpha/beta fold hydrolase [Kofleriaceae bacterium]|jgi:prolyl oligopeptidase
MRRVLVLVLAACGGHPPAPAPRPTPPPPGVDRTPKPPEHQGPPVARVEPVTDTYHGTQVVDRYRWLEADDAAVTAWSAGENTYARGILDHLPEVDKLREELHDIIAAPITRYSGFKSAGGKLFGFRKQPTHEQPELIAIDDPEHADAAKLILDPAAAGGAQEAIDWFAPAPDGKKLAVSLSFGGSETGTLHVVDLDGKDLEPPIPNVQHGTGGGSAAWTPDSKAIYYTRYPHTGEPHADEPDAWMQVWVHQLGTPIATDRYEVGKDLPKIAEIQLDSDPRGRVLASVQNGDGGTFRHYLRDGKGWRQLDDWADAIVSIDFGPTDDLWLVSHAAAPRGKLLRLAGRAKSAAAAKLIVAEGKDSIVSEFEWHEGPVVTKDRVYLTYQTGGPSEIRAFTLDGKPAKSPDLPPVSTAGHPVPWKTGVLVGASSYTTPWTVRYFDPKTGTATEIAALSPKPPVDLSGFEVSRELATSKDGTKVPLNIIWPKGAPKDGSVPCIVNGYGGYGISEAPHFLDTYAPLLRRGVCLVMVNLRGGGEFGEDWHRAGALEHKQNVFDDFAAALHFVIDHKYTSTARLGILGGSNGGLLMGAMITQHPDLVHAVVSEVGIYDMLRTELSPNGAYNVTEYGTVEDPQQFAALYAYSPYHHVVAGTKYPAILMTTGANDPRVSPWQSRKMIAALQAASAGDAPILLRTSDKAGHGIGSSMTERVDLLAHVEAFLLANIR